VTEVRQENNHAAEHEISRAAQQRRLGHELRSTVQGLLGHLSIYQDEVASRLQPEEVHLLERVSYYARRLAELSMDLLNDIQRPTEK
jgi:hypothetical protein